MSHMVIFQTPGGSPGYNQFDSVNEAVAFVEKLRNEQGIENARMFALEEIKFDIKTYYRVELQALNSGAGAPAGQAAPAGGEPRAFSAPQAQPAPAPAPQAQPAPAPEPEAPAPRRGLFGR